MLIDEQVKSSMNETLGYFKRLDVLVNNAGTGVMGNFTEAKLEDFDNMYKIHVRAPVLFMQLAYPHLRKTQGNIINVSSGASDVLKVQSSV